MLVSFSFIQFSSSNTANAATGINHQINFQGKLVNTDGTNVTDGSYSIVFSLYSVASAGSAIWTETQATTAVTNGIFQVNLGSVTTLPGSIDFNTDNIYLGIKVGADAEMTPRIQFTSVPQAFNSEKLGGLDKTGFIQNTTSQQASSNFNISGTGVAGTSLTTPLLQSAPATALTITGNAASTWSTSAGNITLQAGSGTVSLGSTTTLSSTGALTVTGGTTLSLTSTGANAISLDSGTTGGINIGTSANAKTITLGNTTGATSVVIDCGTGACSFGTSATAHTTTVGSTNTTSTTTLQAGTGGVNIGTGGVANTIQIGNTTGAVAQIINIGTNGTASSTSTVLIGSTVANSTIVSTTGAVVQTLSNTGETIKTNTNSATAFQVQNADGGQLLNVDTTDTNVILNSSAESTDISAWLKKLGTESSITRITTQHYIGNAALQLVTTAIANQGIKQNVTLSTGVHTFSAWLKVSSTTSTNFVFGYAADGSTEVDCIAPSPTITTTGWVRYSCTMTTTATSGTPYVYLRQVAATAKALYIDGFQIDDTATATPYSAGTIALNGVINSPTTFQNPVDSTQAVQIQNAAGSSNLFIADTLNGRIGIGGAVSPQQTLTLGSASSQAFETASPATPTLTCNTTGGTLADGTYAYKLGVSDGVGTTVASAEASCAISGGAGAGSVSLSWTAVTGAISYKVYGRTTSGELLMATVNAPTLSYIDDGSVTPAGALPFATTAYNIKFNATGNSWILGGNVGIGIAAPTAKLHVVGSKIAEVATATGTTGGSVLTVAGSVGGNTTIATTGTGGIGGTFSFTGGVGGTASLALTASTGGAGGSITYAGGIGGAADVDGTGTNTGGNGGAFSYIAGAGGAATGNTSGTNTGGNGGAFTLQGGTGGAANTGVGNLVGGTGGAITVSGGTGGIGTTSGGNGGALTLQGGGAAAMAGAAGGAASLLGRGGSATGSGGNGGALNLQGGAAGGDNTVNRTGGTIAMTAGVSKGTSTGGAITLTTGASGQNLTTGTAAGGNGGTLTLTGGAGGTAPNADVLSTGGIGAALTFTGGAGGAASVAGTGNNTGGAGGGFTFTGGSGGAANGVTSGTDTGGIGGAITVRAGTGGAASLGSGSLVGGTGGAFTLQAGTGGTGTTTTGNGGNLTLNGGIAGAATGTGGFIALQTASANALTERLRITSAGNVGIGASDPARRLTVVAPDAVTSQIELRSTRAAIVSGNVLGGLDFFSNDTELTAPGIKTASIQAVASATQTASVLDTDLVFSTTSGTTLSEALRIKGNNDILYNGSNIVGTGLLNIDAGTTTTLSVGSSANNKTVNIGAVAATANTTTVNIATSTGAAQTVAIGSNNGASAVTLTAGSGNINLQSAIIVGNAATQDLFNTVATTLNVGGAATTFNLGPVGATATSINLAGGSGASGCTIDGATGNLACSGNLTGAATGTQGYLSRAGTVLQPATAGDSFTTSGSISTTSTGTITSAGLLTGSAGAVFGGGSTRVTSGNDLRVERNTGQYLYFDGDGGSSSAGVIGQLTAENNKKNLYFDNVHDGSGSPAGSEGFIFRTGPQSAPVQVFSIDSLGSGNFAGALIVQAGLTVTGGASSISGGIISLNASSNFATNINTGTSTGAVGIGNNTGNTAITLDSGTSAINIGTGAQARTTNVATGAAVQALTLGSTNTTSTTLIQGGTGATAIALTTGVGGSINLNAGTILGTATTQDLFNTVATILNVGGAATTFNLGPVGATATSINLAGGSAATGCTIDGATGNLVCSGTMTGTTLNGTTGINTGAGAGTNRIDVSGNLVNIGTIASGLINGQTISSAANFTGSLKAAGELQSTSANALRMVQGSYGSFFRNDGNDTLLLLTASGDQYGSWNTLRPLSVNNVTGNVSIGTALTVTGLLTANGGATVSGAAINLNASSNFATNINTGSTTAGVTIGNNTGNSAITIDSGTSAINVGTGAQARTTNIATGAAVQLATLGSTNGASSLTLQAGTGNLNLSASGASNTGVLVRSGTDSTSAFKVQNAAGTSLFTADTTNGRIGIGNVAPSYTLDVASSSSVAGASTIGARIAQADSGAASGVAVTKQGLLVDAAYSGAYSNVAGDMVDLIGLQSNVTYSGTTSGTDLTLRVIGAYFAPVFTGTKGSGTSLGIYGSRTDVADTLHNASKVGSDINVSGTGSNTGLRVNVISTGAASSSYGVTGSVVSSSTAASTEAGGFFALQDTGVVTSGTDTGYGLQVTSARTGATGGTINTYGLSVTASGDNAGAGTSTVTGLSVDVSSSTADTTYAAIFQGGRVGIGTAAPTATLQVAGNALFKNASDTTTAFQVQNAAGTSAVFNADTLTGAVTVRAGTDAASLGPNLTNNNFSTSWTGTNWTLGASSATHITSTSILSPTTPPSITIGAVYQLSYTISGRTNGTVNASVGGVFTGSKSTNATFTEYVTAISTASLQFNPGNTFDGTISLVSLKLVTPSTTPALTVSNASGTANLEVRASSSTSNLFMGLSSGQTNVTGIQNTAVGSLTLQKSTGSDNTAIGYSALQNSGSGNSNTAVGSLSLQSNTTGSSNTAVGTSALTLNTDGTNNTAQGFHALQSNVSGVSNTAVGAFASSNTTGNSNTAIGTSALNNNTTGSDNVALGTSSISGNVTGSNNTGIGTSTSVVFTNLNYATALGSSASVGSSNTIALGQSGSTDSVLIGSSFSTGNKLSVGAQTYNTGNISQSGSTVTGSSTTFVVGMVGGKLYYNDGTSTTITGFTSTTVITVASGSGPSGTYNIVWGGLNVSTTATMQLQNTTNSTAAFQIQNAAGTSVFDVDTTNGYVGIGTNAPGSKLEVQSNAVAVPAITANSTASLGSTTGNISEISNFKGASTNTVQLKTRLYRTASGSDWTTTSLVLQRTVDVTDQAKIAFWGNSSICINTFTCTNALGVSGTIAASGTITASTTPDIAEEIPAAPGVEAADVVAADPNNTERVIKTTSAYQSSAVGVISDGTSSFHINPYGKIEAGAIVRTDIRPMVLAGRVPVKVTNEGGAVRPGDNLTSSSTPGYAMKATHAGPTIGKSLGFFDGTSGTVLAMIQNSYYSPSETGLLQGGNDANFKDLNVTGKATFATLTVTGDAVVEGKLTVASIEVGTITVGGHIITAGDAPLTQALAAAGTGAAVAIDGNDTAGTLTITTGATGMTAGDLAKINFKNAFGKAPKIVLSAQDDASINARVFPGAKTASDYTLKSSQTLAPNTTYTFDYFIVQ